MAIEAKPGSKRGFLYTGLVFLLLAVLGYVFRGELLGSAMAWQIGPDHEFTDQPPPAAPDYSDDNNWAALPQTSDPADERPVEAQSEASGEVPVFFIHPTSYLNKASWNQPLDDETANWIVDERVLRHQASAFNSCCSVFAPRYRQATFYSFIENGANAQQALDLAYGDVADAFAEFLERIPLDSPFVLAGHSQGTKHGARLLAETIANTPLQSRLVAAYLIGFSITEADLGGVPVCSNATQTGCAIGWNAIDGSGRGAFAGIENMLCVNPLNWQHDESYAGHDLNAGGIGYAAYGQAQEDEDITALVVEPGAADAQCKDGNLFIPALRSAAFPQRMLGNSMHVYDYSLFHMNIRQNAQSRVNAF